MTLRNIAKTLFILLACICLCFADQKVKLTDVEALTLYDGQYTAARRLNTVSQLRCTGGSANCQYIPKVVQCYNRGSDGSSVQWECLADMPSKYSFGKIRVGCEGYSGAGDDYILQGSCGLQYDLELNGGNRASTNSHQEVDSGLWSIIVFVVVGLILYSMFSSPSISTAGYYSSYPSYYPGSGGFWSGAATGGAMGYMYGRNSGRPYYSGSSCSGANNNRRASGFGGTNVN